MTNRHTDDSPDTPIHWHALPADEVAARLESGSRGLSADEAAARLLRHGPNQLSAGKEERAWQRLLRQFHNVLLYIMLAAACITALLGLWVDTGVLLAVLIVNAVIGYLQEGKAARALAAIRQLLAPHALVLRDGRRLDIAAADLVPGDRVLLAAGDRVPADLRLDGLRELQIDESALTGESLPAEKDLAAVEPQAPLGDRRGMAYAGTLVTQGQGSGIVVGTGRGTELGQIDQLLDAIDGVGTPLSRQIDRFSYRLAAFILVAAVLVFLFGFLLRQQPAADMFLMVVVLVASAIPEGLPAVLTVTLALGVQRMSRQHAIVRRLPAVETLGSVTTICSDKTGTLTRNEMTVQRLVCGDGVVEIEGAGYQPSGRMLRDGQALQAPEDGALAWAVRAGVLCNDAELRQADDGQWQVLGDPTEGALLVLGHKAGQLPDALGASWPRLDCLPFASENRYMATLHQAPDEARWLLLKGAPERLLTLCDRQLADDGERPIDVDYWRRMATDLAARGLRVLAVARRRASAQGGLLVHDDIEGGGFTLLALVGMEDPPRDEAIRAVARCHQAGIRVKMITGDHADTARAIGARLGIGVGLPALSGAEISLMDDDALRQAVANVDIFARASPEHKLRLIQALQARGEIVAMTGDGVNDAPALKRADIGVAMGGKGTEAAKEAADMVLADDNFATIAAAVREGRAVYDNVRKFLLFMLPTNGGEALILLVALALGLVLPLTPVQVLWINMVTVSTLGLALAFEPAEHDVMTRPPRPPSQPLLGGFFLWRIALVSVLMMLFGLYLFQWELARGTDLETARSLVVTTVVFCEMTYLLNSRYLGASALSRRGLLGNPQVLVAIAACLLLQAAYLYLPFMQLIFETRPLGWQEWSKAALAGVLLFLLIEAEKAWQRWRVRR